MNASNDTPPPLGAYREIPACEDLTEISTFKRMSIASHETSDTCAVRMADQERGKVVACVIPDTRSIEELARMFWLLADPVRADRVVAVRKSGRTAYYRLDDSNVRMPLDLALVHIGRRGETDERRS